MLGARMKSPVRLDPFLLGMAAAVVLAWLWPEPGAQGGALHPELLNKLGVALIFALHGLSIPLEALARGTLAWRIHVVVQLATFGLFPLLGLSVLTLGAGWLEPALGTGIFYLSALPSTVSSSVALTAAARGNVPVAVFNATLSSLLGVVLTPVWLGFVLGSLGQPLPLGSVMVDLVRWLVLPLALGQVLRRWLAAWAARHKPLIARLDRLTILLLIYTSFCDSFQAGVWSAHGWGPLLATAGLAIAFLATVLGALSLCARLLGFSAADRSAALFCGSKKTLASGVPMARLIFGATPDMGLILLPIMIYHPLQLVVGAWLAGRWARRDDPT